MDIPVVGSIPVLYALLYLLIFRLSIVLLGGLSIWLGYRLFTQPTRRRGKNIDDAEVSGKLLGAEFILKNAAPGAFFALFGALIVVQVLADSRPEFTSGMKVTTQDKSGKPVTQEFSNTVRAEDGGGDVLAKTAFQSHENAKNYLFKAIQAAQQAASDPAATAEYHTTLAALYFADGKAGKAMVAQQKALELNPGDTALEKQLEAYKKAR